MVDMCKASGLEKPDEVSVDQVNSAAALMHWRYLVVFPTEIYRKQTEQLRLKYPACEPRRGQTSTVATDYALQSGHIHFREELQLNIYQVSRSLVFPIVMPQEVVFRSRGRL